MAVVGWWHVVPAGIIIIIIIGLKCRRYDAFLASASNWMCAHGISRGSRWDSVCVCANEKMDRHIEWALSSYNRQEPFHDNDDDDKDNDNSDDDNKFIKKCCCAALLFFAPLQSLLIIIATTRPIYDYCWYSTFHLHIVCTSIFMSINAWLLNPMGKFDFYFIFFFHC